MRGEASHVALLIAVPMLCGCGQAVYPLSTPVLHPTLDADYSSRFVGAWGGSLTVTEDGSSRTTGGYQIFTATGFNRLAVVDLCPESGSAGLDSPTTFSMDPMVCAPRVEHCDAARSDQVWTSYRSVTGQLSGAVLTMTIQANASGCGRSRDYTVQFTGTLGGTPSAAVAPEALGPL